MTQMRRLTSRPTTNAVSTEHHDWRDLSTCSTVDPETFFPTGPTKKVHLERAKRICSFCPVQQQCRDWAEETGEAFGVWGGLDEEERDVSGTKLTQFELCVRQRPLIEKRRAAGVSMMRLATELGVHRSTLQTAVRQFEAERAQLDAASLDVAA